MKKLNVLFILLFMVSTLFSCATPGLPADTTLGGDTTDTPITTEAPEEDLKMTLTGNAIFENGSLTAERGKKSFALTEDKITYDFRVSCEINIKAAGISGIFVFSDGEDNGIYFAADYGAQTISLFNVKDGYMDRLGKRSCTFELNQRIPMTVEYKDGVLKASTKILWTPTRIPNSR